MCVCVFARKQQGKLEMVLLQSNLIINEDAIESVTNLIINERMPAIESIQHHHQSKGSLSPIAAMPQP